MDESAWTDGEITAPGVQGRDGPPDRAEADDPSAAPESGQPAGGRDAPPTEGPAGAVGDDL
jgi:hypothetical protein